ncbi:hypothetical protein BH09SUM1_BH09SUM1_23170 [soil metagenome]
MTYHYGSPWSEATLNGRQGMYLIDTGASMSVIDSETARRSGVTPMGQQQVMATSGRVEVQTAWLDSFSFVGYTHENRLASVQDLGTFHGPAGRRQSGLIGADFMLDYNVIFDMQDSKVWLSTRSAPQHQNMTPSRMRLNAGIPQIEIFFGDAREYLWARFDTGSGYADERNVYLDVSEEIAQKLLGERFEQEPEATVRVMSLAGESQLKIFSYGPVMILGKTLPMIKLVAHPQGIGAFAEPDSVLITGSILKEFSFVEVDFPRRQVWVSK